MKKWVFSMLMVYEAIVAMALNKWYYGPGHICSIA